MVLIWGHLFRHNAQQSSHYSSHCMLFIYIYVINVIFSCFTAILMGWAKFVTYIHFGYCICNFYVIYQIIIYIYILIK